MCVVACMINDNNYAADQLLSAKTFLKKHEDLSLLEFLKAHTVFLTKLLSLHFMFLAILDYSAKKLSHLNSNFFSATSRIYLIFYVISSFFSLLYRFLLFIAFRPWPLSWLAGYCSQKKTVTFMAFFYISLPSTWERDVYIFGNTRTAIKNQLVL